MVHIMHLNDGFAVAEQLAADDFAAVAAAGFKSVICNRPDGEEASQLTAHEASSRAADAGLAFLHLPLMMSDALDPAAAYATRDAINHLPRPILAYCKSGTRSAIAWASATTSHDESVEDAIAALRRADFDIPGLADELRARQMLRG